ncbi:fumarylacetoacetate hydrolase family protein [Pontibacillus litoralis]|uniref:2-hydroxyhepta-2,4-diene-1,7-dioate isomerase n=1 Tax=Pontibacillus litoralis JSM 072002 TaxID=1385512 RepID=A0A0A5HLS1_9BACI|nr:fumarylacetoacetate hydrolase family protein [Pontibacillus litoralis]KGX84552.1 2-hydroxyhepta-2,4-diene-1,7-dioate isomerase [Pontibacillus litoralis JSM 072002]
MAFVKANLGGSIQSSVLEVDVDSFEIKSLNSNTALIQSIWNPPISGTVYGVLLNYQSSLEQMGEALTQDPYKLPPQAPILYIKPKNTFLGHRGEVPMPAEVDELEVGASIGVVIGEKATQLSVEEALDYVEGYTVVNDISIPHESVFRPAIKEKVRNGFCPTGPWIMEKKAVGNIDDKTIQVYVNGELKQQNTTKNLVRSVSQLLSDVTEFMTLYKGDVLLVGVPENCPKVTRNDHIRIEIESIGTLENTVK